MKSTSASTTASNNGASGFHCVPRETLKSFLNTVNQVCPGTTGIPFEIFLNHDTQITIYMITINGGTSQMLGLVKFVKIIWQILLSLLECVARNWILLSCIGSSSSQSLQSRLDHHVLQLLMAAQIVPEILFKSPPPRQEKKIYITVWCKMLAGVASYRFQACRILFSVLCNSFWKKKNFFKREETDCLWFIRIFRLVQ